MKFVTYASYVPDQEAVDDLRPEHFEYLAGLLAEGKLAAAGSFADGSGGLFIYDMDTFEDAKAAVSADPFAAGGAFARYEVKPWQADLANFGLATFPRTVHYRRAVVDGVNVAYREAGPPRSEEHTSELQSRRDLVCRLLLEKKKKKRKQKHNQKKKKKKKKKK